MPPYTVPLFTVQKLSQNAEVVCGKTEYTMNQQLIEPAVVAFSE